MPIHYETTLYVQALENQICELERRLEWIYRFHNIPDYKHTCRKNKEEDLFTLEAEF